MIQIQVPPLRERIEDIPVLVKAFLQDESLRTGREIRIEDGAVEKLCLHPWPGNLRELENVLKRLLITSGDRICADDVELPPVPARDSSSVLAPAFRGRMSYRQAREALDREFLLDALRSAKGNISAAAKLLGLNRRSLYKKMRRHGIVDPRAGE